MLNLEYNGKLVLIPLAIYLIMLFRYRKYIQNPNLNESRHESIILFILLVLSSVFAFESHDTYHYNEGFKLAKEDGGYYEDIYKFFSLLTNNYFVWRLMIWGPASLFILLAARKAGVKLGILGFVIPLFFLTQFVITRGAFGFSFMLLCIIFASSEIASKKINFKSILILILSLVGIWYSSELHRSIIIFLVLLPISLLIPLKKSTLYALMILFPVFYIGATYLLNLFAGLEVLIEKQEFILGYSEVEEINLSINGFIRVYLERAPWYLMGIPMLYALVNEKNLTIRILAKYSLLLVYVSAITFRQESIGPWLSVRTIHAASFPLLICEGYFLQNYKIDRWTRLSICLFITTVLLYHFFVNILNWW